MGLIEKGSVYNPTLGTVANAGPKYMIPYTFRNPIGRKITFNCVFENKTQKIEVLPFGEVTKVFEGTSSNSRLTTNSYSTDWSDA